MDNLTDSFIEKKYKELFSHDTNFQNVYLGRRNELYREVLSIIKEFKIDSFLDIGCAYGQLVEWANEEGVNAHGLDLPIRQLENYH
jgi:2-polyprenyl-3-methyl-5-hydroxy-6-metoxy-1,4-benzoquinol methylase